MADGEPAVDLPTGAEASVAWSAVAGLADRGRALEWLDENAAPRARVEPWLRVTTVLAAAAARGAFSGERGGDLSARALRDLHRRDLRARANVLAELARVAVRGAGTLGAASLDVLAPRSIRRTGVGARIADELGRRPIGSMLDGPRASASGLDARPAGHPAAMEFEAATAGRDAREDARHTARCIEVAGAFLALARSLADGFEVRLAEREVAVATGRCADEAPTAALRAAARVAPDAWGAEDAVDRVEIARAMALGRFERARDALERPPFAFERDVATAALRCTAAALIGAPGPGGLVVAGCVAPGAPPRRRAARVLLGLERFRRALASAGSAERVRPTTRRAGQRRRRRR